LGCLVFVVATMLVINAWGVVDARMAAEAVARQIARTLVEAKPRSGLACTTPPTTSSATGSTNSPNSARLGWRPSRTQPPHQPPRRSPRDRKRG